MGMTRSAYRHIFDKKPYNKFGNHHTYIDGVHFSSKREAHRYEELLLCLKSGTIQDLKCQPKFPFPIGFEYRADFSYTQDGKTIIEDVKGFETDVFILKEKCFKYFYPELELRIIK
jgi:hypothetical protein